MPKPFDPKSYHEVLQRFLAEDLGTGDITTTLLVPEGRRARGAFLAKGHLVLAGVELFAEVFRLLEPSIDIQLNRRDGEEPERSAVGDSRLCDVVATTGTSD